MYYLILIFYFLFNIHIYAYTITIPARKETCFYEFVSRGDKISGSYRVVKGGSLDIDVNIYDMDTNTLIYEILKDREGSFAYLASKTSTHRICFSNKMSGVTPKTLSFNFYTWEMELARHEHVTPLQQAIESLLENTRRSSDECQYAKIRDRVCRGTNESTNLRVKWWAIIQMCTLFLMYFYQVNYLRTLFEKTREY